MALSHDEALVLAFRTELEQDPPRRPSAADNPDGRGGEMKSPDAMYELRIVEVTEALPSREPPTREVPTPRARPTAQETFEALLAHEGAAGVIEQVPSLARAELWEEVAYFDVRGWSGPAAGAVAFWDADLDARYSLEDFLANDFMFFAGASWGRHFGAPGTTTGRIGCFFYLPQLPPPPPQESVALPLPSVDLTFHARLYSYGPPDWEPEEPKVQFFIDEQVPLGERVLPHGWVDTVLHLRLVNGPHLFEIRQAKGSGSFLFQNVSVWKSSVLAPPGPVA
jgi:hypothetical protein